MIFSMRQALNNSSKMTTRASVQQLAQMILYCPLQGTHSKALSLVRMLANDESDNVWGQIQ